MLLGHYEQNYPLRMVQRPPRDCRGPGALFNPVAGAGSAAGDGPVCATSAGPGTSHRRDTGHAGTSSTNGRKRTRSHARGRRARDYDTSIESGRSEISAENRSRQAHNDACGGDAGGANA